MEIVFNSVGYKDKFNNIDLKIVNSFIVGLIGKNKEIFIKMLLGDIYPLTGNVTVNNIDCCKKNGKLLKKQVAYIRRQPLDYFKSDIVLEHIYYVIENKKYKNSNMSKKIKDSFSLVGLDEEYLDRSFNSLSSSELYLIQIAIEFVCNPKIIIFEDPFINLDYHNKKRLLKLLKILKEKYHKMIFISDNDVDILYQYTDKILFINDCNKVKLYDTYDFFTSVKFLNAHSIKLPRLVDITYRGKLKGAKLTYQKDIRDIIKDIYKHV